MNDVFVVRTVEGYVIKTGGFVMFTDDPTQATKYDSRDSAKECGLVGHHKDMGGNGFRGQVIKLEHGV